MNTLQIRLFGRVRITHDNGQSEVKLTRGLQALLAYLLLNRRDLHPREVLAGLFWGEFSKEKARDSLNTALWRIRNALEPAGVPAGTYLISSHSGEVGFNVDSPYWLDVGVFEDTVRAVTGRPVHVVNEAQASELENVLPLYTGDLMDGFYEDWILREREHLRFQYIKGLRFLLQFSRQHHSIEQAIIHGQTLLYFDPLLEEIHREVMRLHLESGQRTQAVRQFEVCRKILADELGIPPMPETQALYEQALTGTVPLRVSLTSVEASVLEQTFQQLNQAVQSLNQAYALIIQAFQRIEKLTGRQGIPLPAELSQTQNLVNLVPWNDNDKI